MRSCPKRSAINRRVEVRDVSTDCEMDRHWCSRLVSSTQQRIFLMSRFRCDELATNSLAQTDFVSHALLGSSIQEFSGFISRPELALAQGSIDVFSRCYYHCYFGVMDQYRPVRCDRRQKSFPH